MLKSLFTAALLALAVSSPAMAFINFDEYSGYDFGGYGSYLPAEPPPRTYKSAQGDINLDSFEGLLSAQLLGKSVQILEIRWPYNPFDYTNYLLGSVIETLTDDKDSKFGTYVVYLRLDGNHDGTCVLNLTPGSKRGRIHNCRSSSAKILLHHSFDFSAVGLR